MLRSLTIEKDHQQYIDCWFDILDLHIQSNNEFCSLLNLLLHGLFSETGKFDNKQVQKLSNRFNSKQILNLGLNCKFFFFKKN